MKNDNQPPLGILPINAFRERVRMTSLDYYRADPRTRVTDEAAYQEMQEHISKLHEGVEVVHSFEDQAGHVFDCIPISQQPSLRGKSGDLPIPPDLTPVLQGRPPEPRMPALEQVREHGRRDRHGNLMQAPPGTIPVRRITLDELVRFRTLNDFFRKDPGSREPHPAAPQTVITETRPRPSMPSPDTKENHRYAYTHQTVDNIGAHNVLALYAPSVNSDQVFSLAQHWYTGGSGSDHQTLEVGWQVYPDKYHHSLPALFIYWTADNYVNTGAYNLDAPGFVQTNGNWTLGGALSPVSTQGGQQMEIEIAVYLFQNNWWIYLGGLAPENALGYYPTSLYAGGQMATNAQEILFGGETVCRAVSWPSMGSGVFASEGWQQAAYQRDIFYFPPTGGSQWTTLTAEQPSPGCYTLDLNSAVAPWGVYFFYGGPGGGDC